MFDEVTKINLLYDFYGQLLSSRQAQVMDLYYGENLSLSEIAGELGISRQGVHDALKNAEKSLTGYEQKLGLVKRFEETGKRTGASVAGPIPMPTKRRVYCVLRSPHVDKKSREHFEMRTHKRIIDIYEPTQQTTEELSRMDLPSGVDIEVKL